MDCEYIDKLSNKLSRYFDIERDWDFENLHCDLYAKSFVQSEKFFFTRKAKVYSFETFEHCLVKYYPQLSRQELSEFIESLKDAADQLVVPHEEHMSSIVTGVLVVEQQPEPEIIDAVKRFKFHKGFAFGFKGWMDIRLILVHPDSGEVVSNKKGKEVAKFYAAK